MFDRILVPLDGSDLAQRALEPAATLSERHEAELVLLRVSVPEKMLVPDSHVAGGYGVLWPDQSLEQARTHAQDYLRAARRGLTPRAVNTRLEVVEGAVAESIVDVATQLQAGLILMSSHGYSGVKRWVLGSVAERVLDAAPCPVVVLRSPRPVRHVLIPLDGSDLSERAAAPALTLAAGLGASATLLRAVPAVTPQEKDRLDALERGLGDRLEDEIRRDAEKYLREVFERERVPGVEIAIAVTDEPAADAILNYAETQAVDLIAMSTHGRTGLRRWLYGSVTEKVLHGGSCSMLVVRPAPEHLS